MMNPQAVDIHGMVQETATTLIGMVVGMAVLRMASGMSRGSSRLDV